MLRIIGAGLWAIIVSAVVNFIPTIIAYVKDNLNKAQELLYQIIVFVVSFLIGLVLWLLPKIFIFKLIGDIWGIIVLGLWIYFLYCAFKDKEMPRP